jgi:hypothetical protein
MAEAVDVGIAGGGDEASGVLSLVAGGDMQAGDDDVEFSQQVVGKVEAVAEDVHFGAGEESEVVIFFGEALVEGVDVVELPAETGGVESVGLDGGAGVVGDGPIGEAEVLGVGGDVFEGLTAVGPVGVIVEGAFEVGPFDEAGEVVVFGGGELAVVLAEFRGDELEAEAVEDFLFGMAADQELGVAGFLGGAEESVFIEAQAAGNGALAHDDVVFLAAGEVGEGEGVLGVGDHAEVGLHTVAKVNTGFGVAVAEDLDDVGEGDEVLEDSGGVFGGRDEVEVTDDFLPAAERTGGGTAEDFGVLAEGIEDGFGGGEGVEEAVFGGELLFEGEGLEEVLLGFFAEAVEGGDLVGVTGGFQFFEGIDTQFEVEATDFFGAEAG